MTKAFRLLFTPIIFALAAMLPAQTSTDTNEGLTLSNTTNTSAFTLSWWGHSGRTYFVQNSEDLHSWSYLPLIESGANAVIQYGFTNTSDRFFFRLKHTDQTASNPATADFDNDGVSNWDELLQGADPFVPLGARLAITWPSEGATIPARTVDVTGTWGAIASLTSLTLNGSPVFISGNTWSAPAIPLVNGSNTLTLISTDAKGVVTTLTRNITASYATNAPAPVTLTADTVSGNTPLLVTFTPQLNISGTIQSVTYYFQSRVQASAPVSNLDPTSFTYQSAGTYYPTVTIRLTDGSIYSSGGLSTPIAERLTIQAGTSENSPLAVWSAFGSAIAAQDIESAASHLAAPRSDALKEFLIDLGPVEAAKITTDLAAPSEVVTFSEVAQYQITIMTSFGESTFPINFLKEDGLWKIDEF
jgi:hypothetical protein